MRHLPRWLGAIAISTALTTLTPEGHAGDRLEGIGTAIVITMAAGVLGVGNVVVSIPDLVYVAKGQPQPTALAVTKIVLCAPQTLFYHGIASYFASELSDIEAITLLPTLMGAWTGAMTTSAIWSLNDDIDPASLYGISWAIGANSAFTAAAFGTFFSKRPAYSKKFGIAEMVMMTPSIAVSALRLTDPTASRGAWAALGGWSGLLFVHGLVTTVRGGKGEEEAEAEKNAMIAPPIHFGPTLVSDGVQQMPGLMIAGKF